MERIDRFIHIRLFFLLLVIFCAGSKMTLYAEIPKVEMDSAGSAVTIWHEVNPANHLYRIRSSTFIGGIWSSPITISNSATHSFLPRPAIAATTGNAVALWYSIDSTGARSIQAAQYIKGSGWSAPVNLAALHPNTDPEIDYDVAISENAPNTMVAIWTATLNGIFVTFTAHANIGGGWTSP